MRRITPEEVREAFEQERLDPTRGGFGNGCTTACPLIAMYIHNSNEPVERRSPLLADKAFYWAAKYYGDLYAAAFAEAWDGGGRDRECVTRPDYQRGYSDGLAVRAVLWPETPAQP